MRTEFEVRVLTFDVVSEDGNEPGKFKGWHKATFWTFLDMDISISAYGKDQMEAANQLENACMRIDEKSVGLLRGAIVSYFENEAERAKL